MNAVAAASCHHLPMTSSVCASESIVPQDTMSTGTPSPRNDRITSTLPNVSHVILVQLSLLVVAFIKVEVILSFLGLGVPVDMVSWGTMLSEAQTELVIGKWWQLAAATAFMAVFLTAFSMLTDSLRDALDPKLR